MPDGEPGLAKDKKVQPSEEAVNRQESLYEAGHPSQEQSPNR
jgi:hypothetical protein